MPAQIQAYGKDSTLNSNALAEFERTGTHTTRRKEAKKQQTKPEYDAARG